MISLGSMVRFVFISFFPLLLAFTHLINHHRVPLECQVPCWAFWRRQKDEGTRYYYQEAHRLIEQYFHSCTLVVDTVHIKEGTFLNQSLLHLKTPTQIGESHSASQRSELFSLPPQMNQHLT